MVGASVANFWGLPADDYAEFSATKPTIHNAAEKVASTCCCSIQSPLAPSVYLVFHALIYVLHLLPKFIGNNLQ